MTNQLYSKRNAKRFQKRREEELAFKNHQSLTLRRRIEDRAVERQLNVTLDKWSCTL
jgi:hypothetical protein